MRSFASYDGTRIGYREIGDGPPLVCLPGGPRAYMPFFYGRWDDAARAHVDVGISERSRLARDGFRAEGAFNPTATREAVRKLAASVLVYAGEYDFAPTLDAVAVAAQLFTNATVTIQPGAGHFPWLDDPAFFATAITSFLS